MPNWAEGYLRIRGTAEKILRFLNEEVVFCCENFEKRDEHGFIMTETVKVEFYMDEFNEVNASLDKTMKSISEKCSFPRFYINGTRRNFIEHDIEFEVEDDAHEMVVILTGFNAAWGVETDPYTAKSKKHDVDIKIDVWEKNMGFSQHIEIIKGNVIRDEDIEYDDWDWESENPRFGG